MIFRPVDTKLWDTFILPHEGRFYLFYNQIERSPDKPLGYGLAISEDLIHWQDRGTILEGILGKTGLGSGMVWRAGGKWMLNYSQVGKEGAQRIFFAESDDLLTWRLLPEENVCAPDPRWYESTKATASTSARWDSIWVIPQEDGTFLGTLTAASKDGPAGANGVVGLVSSKDGIHWKAEPPASESCGMAWAEAIGYVQFGPRHYVFVISGSHQGVRFDPVYTTVGQGGGVYLMMSDNVRGPYRLVEGDPLLFGGRNDPAIPFGYCPVWCLRTTPSPVDGQILVYHHWMPRADVSDAWLGTIKILQEAAPGKLLIKYWPGNEKLKGKKVFDLKTASFPSTPSPQAIPTTKWEFSGGVLKGQSGGSGLAFFELDPNYEKGVVIELELTLSGDGAAGLFFGSEIPDYENHPWLKSLPRASAELYEGLGCLANRRGLYEFGSVGYGFCGPVFMPENHSLHPVPEGKPAHWRILIRGEFIELYVDDDLVQCYGFSKPATHNLGIFVERGGVEVKNLKVYRFTQVL